MLRVLLLLLLGALSGSLAAQPEQDISVQDSLRVNLPWPEFKTLYRENLRRELSPSKKIKPLYSIDQADYQLSIDADGAKGYLQLSGTLLQGEPSPIRLFAADLIIAKVLATKGGVLLSDTNGYRLHLNQTGEFRLECEILLSKQQDSRSALIEFAIPAAVQNRLQIQLAEGLSVLSAPGQEIAAGQYHFAPQQRLSIRYVQDSLSQAPVIDSFTRLYWQEGKYRAQVYLAPRRDIQQPVQLNFPQARWLSGSIPSSQIKALQAGQWQLQLPPGWQQALHLEFELDDELSELYLPQIVDNLGQEGQFYIVNPESAQLNFEGAGLKRGLDPATLPSGLKEAANSVRTYARLPVEQPLQLTLNHFNTLQEPAIILDTVQHYTSIADNGSVLSVLRLEVPPLPEQRLKIAAISGAEIWSLTVNGQARTVYTQNQQNWVIPLGAETAIIELAYWRKTEPLQLQGRLELALPELGIAAQKYQWTIGLPERVELVALEGDLTPASGQKWPKVSQFSGKPYYFTQPFYRGESGSIAIHYREPIELKGKSS